MFAQIKNPKKKRKLISSPEKVSFQINTLEDLLDFAWTYDRDDLGIDWFTLWTMIPYLTQLNNMIGMQSLKTKIVEQIIYYIQNLHNKDKDILHTVICGPPGVGKTTVAKILANIYCHLGILPTDKVTIAGKEDFVAEYIGQTEAKTTKLLKDSLGGVLFIDEVYTLGYSSKNNGKPDSFSKIAIDILNRFLSEYQGEFICIIAGYENDIEESFFSVNKGLRRRFPIKYKIDSYTPLELLQIFRKMVIDNEWKLSKRKRVEELFQKNKDLFSFGGGDMEVLLTCCKNAHAKRIFGTSSLRKYINSKDLEEGFKIFEKMRTVKTPKDDIVNLYFS